jgi:MscS family membrane protein
MNFLDYSFLDNTVRAYLIVVATILFAFLIKRLISRYIAGLLFKMVRAIARGVDRQAFINLVVSPLETFLVIFITIIAIDKLRFPSVLDFRIYRVSVQSVFDTVSVIIFILTFIWLLLRIIDFIAMILEQKANLAKDMNDNQLILFFKDFFKVLLVILGILLIMKFGFRFQISSLITGLSIAGAAIALATRESIENLIASFIIFFDKPFTIGDQVKVHNITGTVEKIGLRSTRIRTDQKTYVTMPNKQMVDSIMDNLSLRTQRRATLVIELEASTTTDSLNTFIAEVNGLLARRSERIENFSVFLLDITRSAFVVNVEFFTATIPIADFNLVRQQVNFEIIQLMEKMKIKLASKESV